ncbi:MAG: ABC transporter ATP-binding protein [Candidatus Roizmanbacteria bacterium]|nr:ABC transporter ATP-binding protein [Candidatus Roizmanbacteria bacterium]
MASVKPLIQTEHLGKIYKGPAGDYTALSDINLTIFPGEFVAIMGPSGSGKSTLMHILGALDTPTNGTYQLKGKDISSYNDDQLAEIRNKEIGFIFQSFNLLPRTTVLKNVERPMVYANVSPKERLTRALNALSMMQIASKADNLSNHISGGQIQRVAIARALVMNPTILLADEPTGNLDMKTSHEIMKIIARMNREGRTVILITHEPDIAEYANRKIKIVDGHIVSDTKKRGKK